jgi:hypothetical protein
MVPVKEVVRAQDRERVRSVVGGGDEDVALVRPDHGRVAVTGEDPGRDVVGEQRPPLDVRLGKLRRLGEGVGDPGAPIVGERPEEAGIIGLLPAREVIVARFGAAGAADRDSAPLPVLRGLDFKGVSCIFRHRRAVSRLALIIQMV